MKRSVCSGLGLLVLRRSRIFGFTFYFVFTKKGGIRKFGGLPRQNVSLLAGCSYVLYSLLALVHGIIANLIMC